MTETIEATMDREPLLIGEAPLQDEMLRGPAETDAQLAALTDEVDKVFDGLETQLRQVLNVKQPGSGDGMNSYVS